MAAGETDTWQWPRLVIRNIHQHGDPQVHTLQPSQASTGHRNLSHNPQAQVYTLAPPARSHPLPVPGIPGTSAHYPAPTPFIPLSMGRYSPSCRCPDGRCLPARSGGCSRARSPHGCRCRRSRASTPRIRTRKSTALGDRRHPGDAARVTGGVAMGVARGPVRGAARRAGCSGLWTPASWCRAQGRARRPPRLVSGAGTEGPTDAHTWPGTARSLQLRGPGGGAF